MPEVSHLTEFKYTFQIYNMGLKLWEMREAAIQLEGAYCHKHGCGFDYVTDQKVKGKWVMNAFLSQLTKKKG